MSGALHLTFDDGPDEVWTPRLLEMLKRMDVCATFFPIGERVAAKPELTLAVVEAGHQVELHCMRHTLHSRLTREELEDDVNEALGVLSKLGIRPRHWRPPGGEVATWTAAIAAANGLRLAGWSADTFDWREDAPATMLELVEGAIGPAAVVLMHDGIGPGALRSGCEGTVAVVERIVALARERGLEPSVLGKGSPLQSMGPPCFREGARPAPPAAARTQVVAERDIPDATRVALVDLLSAAFPAVAREYADRAWRTIAPAFRVLAQADGKVVGQISAFPLESDPSRRIYGVGDAAVVVDRRRLGIGRALVDDVMRACWAAGADGVLTDSVDLEPAFAAWGMTRVPPFSFYYERDGVCRRHRHWLAAYRNGAAPTRIRLAEGDF
jgi:peptidoglycan/xylan/chitin deacetylase (PgdA/CDA1 family)/GNAT superfamily N-acetyltransferase